MKERSKTSNWMVDPFSLIIANLWLAWMLRTLIGVVWGLSADDFCHA